MKIYLKLFITILYSMVMSSVLAQSYSTEFINIHINNQNKISAQDIKKTKDTIEQIGLTPDIRNNIEMLKVNINFENNIDTISFSNASKKCNVTLNYHNTKAGVLFKNFYQDFKFTLFHEISHCILGKRIFRNGIGWEEELKLSKENIHFLNEKIERLTNETTIEEQCNTTCLPNKVFKKIHPLTVYHEIYADNMAMYFQQKENCKIANELFPKLIQLRFNSYQKQPEQYIHQSFRAFNYWDDSKICNKEIDFKKISFYTQQGFIDYLSEQK